MIRRTVRPSILLALTTLVALGAALAAYAGAPPVEPGDLLGSTGAIGSSLISIDPDTGAGQYRFDLGSLGPVTEIEFRDDGVLFGSTGQGSSNIITIDPDTGVETLVGQHAFGAVNGLEFVGNTLYGAFFDAQMGGGVGAALTYLVEVNQTDGSLTTIGEIVGYSPVRGLAWDPDTSTMYGVGSPTTTPPGEGLGDQLFTIDLTTGMPTLIGPTGFEILGGIEFGPDGLLYGGVAIGAQPPPPPPPPPQEGTGDDGSLVLVNTATGAATVVGPTGSPAISGLSFVPGLGPTVSPLEIPTLSQLGLVLLVGLLAGAGLLLLRRLS